jgi:hypothetical protein
MILGMSRRLGAISGGVALGASAFLVVFFVLLNHNQPIQNTGWDGAAQVLVARTAIAKGTPGKDIWSKVLFSSRLVRSSQVKPGAFADPESFRGEVTVRRIYRGEQLTAADFALRSPIYYPRGYPKSVSPSQTPAEMSDYLGPPSFTSDLAVAPGVWVDGSPREAAIDEHVANGTLVGYCRSVRAFRAHNPEIPFATKCWRT